MVLLAGSGVLLSRVPVYDSSERPHYMLTEVPKDS
jgi:hypothetical protein